MAIRYNKKLVIIMIMLILFSCTSCGVKQNTDKQEVKKSECAEMQLFEYPTQYSQVSGNRYFYLRKNAKGDYILHQDGNKEILSFRLSKQKLRGFAVWNSQYYVLVRNEVGTLQFGKVDGNGEVDILCDVYAQKEIRSIILYNDSLFMCENNSNIIERQSINGQTRTPISLDADSDEISFFGSEKIGGICAMDVRKDGKIEVVVFDWQGNRKRTLHSQMELWEHSNLPKGKDGIYVDKIIGKYICFTYYCGKKYFAGRMNLDTNRTETLELSSEEVCDTSFAAEGVYFVSRDRTISYQEWGKNSSQKISELQAEEIDIVGEWLYVRGYSKEWEFLEDNDKEASDEWSDVLYRIRCVDGKVEKLEENNPVDETEMR